MKTFRKRRTSFTVTVIREKDGFRHYWIRCRACKRPLGSVQEMMRHAKNHFDNLDIEQMKPTTWEKEKGEHRST